MKRTTPLKSLIVAAGVLGLVACGGQQQITPEMFDAEVQKLVDAGDMHGELFLVLKERRPELYNEFRKIAMNEFSNGRTARQAGYNAGVRMREKFVEELLSLSRAASDEQVTEMIAIVLDTYRHLNENDPQDCVRNIKGLPPENIKDVPKALQERETALVVAMLKEPQTARNRRAASVNEVTNWMGNVVQLEPEIGQALRLLESERLKTEQAEQACNGMIDLYKRLSYKKSDVRGTLFRGMALMALQEAGQREKAES